MSDERDLTPEQEARVARLLAEARHDEPMPSEVAERLDRVLAGMAGEEVPTAPERDAPVVDLAARRRRTATGLLVAAAAVVVLGVGVGQLTGSDDDNGRPDTTSAEDGGAGLGGAEDEAQQAAPERSRGMTQDELESLGEPARITGRSFPAAVRRLQEQPGVRSDGSSGLMSDRDLTAKARRFSCGAADYGDGKLLAVRYNGTPAVLAYRPPAGQSQVVELLQCGSGDVLRSTTIPLP